MEGLELIIFELITNSGSARSYAFEALEAAKNNDYKKSKEYLETAREEILKAHNAQTSLIQREANGDKIELNMLLIHAQDHLMTSILAKDLLEKMIDMQMEINQLRGINQNEKR